MCSYFIFINFYMTKKNNKTSGRAGQQTTKKTVTKITTRLQTTITKTVTRTKFVNANVPKQVRDVIYSRINSEIDISKKNNDGKIKRGLYSSLAQKYFYNGLLNCKNIQKHYERYSKRKQQCKFKMYTCWPWPQSVALNAYSGILLNYNYY